MNSNTEKLTELLNGRDGWRLEEWDGEQHWCFGVDGGARLVITPEMDGFLMFRKDEDVSWVIPRIDQVGAWLEEHEHEHTGLSWAGQQWKAAAQEAARRLLEAEPGES